MHFNFLQQQFFWHIFFNFKLYAIKWNWRKTYENLLGLCLDLLFKIFLKFQKCECPLSGIVREALDVSDMLFSCWTLKLLTEFYHCDLQADCYAAVSKCQEIKLFLSPCMAK